MLYKFKTSSDKMFLPCSKGYSLTSPQTPATNCSFARHLWTKIGTWIHPTHMTAHNSHAIIFQPIAWNSILRPRTFSRIIHKITRCFNWIKELLFPVPFSKHRSFSSFYLIPLPFFNQKRTNSREIPGTPFPHVGPQSRIPLHPGRLTWNLQITHL